MDLEGYPENAKLEFIRNYDVIKLPIKPLIEHIESIWWSPSFGFRLTARKDKIKSYYRDIDGKEYTKFDSFKVLKLSTGGWSGNEDIITALEQNKMFFACFWVQSNRGGHYVFEINVNYWERGMS